ncbi:MAG: glutathione transferase GstA [Stenotrophobium sp.]
MKLYFSPAACSLSPHIVACEAGIDLQLENVDLKTHKTAGGEDFYAVNPKGYVPSLRLADGTVLTEGPAIVQYLADQKPASKLAPANGTIERYRLQEWLNFISTKVHKPMGSLFNPAIKPEQRESAIKQLGGRCDYLAKALAGKAWLMGETFTAADAYLYTILNWANFVKVDMSKWPALTQYVGRIAARPGVQKALKAEGLIK